jgi:hypothetical protein
MGEVTMSARDEYAIARVELARLRDNHTRASARGDRAIALAYSQRIAEHLAMMARIERRIMRESEA